MQQHLDEELATLSLLAAEELDRRLAGKRTRTNVLKDLGNQLKRASGLSKHQGRAFLHSDPYVTEIFARAASAASSEPVADIEHLSQIMAKIIGPMIEHNDELSDEILSMVKAFCLAFHRSMMAYDTPSRYERDYFRDDNGLIRA